MHGVRKIRPYFFRGSKVRKAVIEPQANLSLARPTVSGELNISKKSNIALTSSLCFGVIFGFVVAGSIINPRQANQTLAAQEVKSENLIKNSLTYTAKPLAPVSNRVADANMASALAQTANLPVATDVAIKSAVVSSEEELKQTTSASAIAKPAIVELDQVVGSVTTYVVQEGEDVNAVANQTGVSAQTIKWANGLTGDAVDAGKELKILPVDGVLYKVKSGDSVDSIAEKYQASAPRIVAYNNLENQALAEGQEVVIPSGVLPETERPGYVPPRPAPVYRATTTFYNYSAFGGGGRINVRTLPNNMGKTGGNRYAWGNCTWYAYERRVQLGRPIGGLWGNATSWAGSARANGFVVNNTPAPGAIFQNHGGYGHVGIVESVFPNGDIYVTEMNYQGLNVISGAIISANSVGRYNYIH